VPWITLDTQDLSNYLEFSSVFAMYLETYTAPYLGELSGQMDQGAFWPNVFGYAISDNVRACGVFPFCAYFDGSQIPWPLTVFRFKLTRHGKPLLIKRVREALFFFRPKLFQH
jgi:hypothetical protein